MKIRKPQNRTPKSHPYTQAEDTIDIEALLAAARMGSVVKTRTALEALMVRKVTFKIKLSDAPPEAPVSDKRREQTGDGVVAPAKVTISAGEHRGEALIETSQV